MDTKTKQSQGGKVKRQLTEALQPFGFTRSKSSFWVRPQEHFVEFIHLHLFTFMPAFRVHLGIRVLNDTFEAIALNGPESRDGWYGQGEDKLVFRFDQTPESVTRCAIHIARFCQLVAQPWFSNLASTRNLLDSQDSPLDDQVKDRLRRAIQSKADPAAVLQSQRLLGMRNARRC